MTRAINHFVNYVLALKRRNRNYFVIDSINNLFTIDSALLTTITGILLIFVSLGEIGMAVALLMKKIVPATKE